MTFEERCDQGQTIRDAAYKIYADIEAFRQDARALWLEGDLLRQEWVVKEGTPLNQVKHYCPEPTHAWPKPGALWFDVEIGAVKVTCPDCKKTTPVTRLYSVTQYRQRCSACHAHERAPNCLRCGKCKR